MNRKNISVQSIETTLMNKRYKKTALAAAMSIVLTTAVFNPAVAIPDKPVIQDNDTNVVAPIVSFASLIEAVKPAVVNVSVTGKDSHRVILPKRNFELPPGSPFEDLFRHFFEEIPEGKPQPGPNRHARSVGSGFIIEASGYVVTNYHVIDGAEEITVTLNDGTRYTAKLTGTDPKTDLALIKVASEKPLPFVSFGDSNNARTGDWVLAIGNPFGLGGTATTGIISARGRDIQSGPFDDYIQIDAPINQGNSGGPLFDTSGRVIGVNTAIYSPNGGNVGIGFAIPSSIAESVISQLRDKGRVDRGWLGVTIQPLSAEFAESLDLDTEKGVLVASVVTDSPAAKAGVRPGDVIVSFNGKEVNQMKDLPWLVAELKAGQKAEMEVWRQGKLRTLNPIIRSAPSEQTEPVRLGASNQHPNGQLGLTLANLTPELRQRYGISNGADGVLIVEVQPNSPAHQKGLQPGDVISMVGQTKVDNPQDVVREIKAASTQRESILLLVEHGDEKRFIALNLA